ncbi:MFS transporter [Pelomonas aquatica]|jgi:MFS family permease|uniref:MFS transporter n=1 Tax=Pelomonas aquatica TaxID=431058 RepID=A0A9X4LJC3_9BURK|nr:MFS transporter [Pelomonas aquatica]MCY4756589.1 MFS transporter [Pelomonas aquatica]MDG0863944.1 MFS transporter [Pelomonas aquatica]
MNTHAISAAPATPPLATSEFRSGWKTLLLALAGVATSVSALLIYSLGTLIVPLSDALGWSKADLQLLVSFLAAGGAVSVNFVGWLNARYGMRAVTGVSMLALVLAFASLTLASSAIGWLYLGYFLLPFIGIGTTPVTWTHIVNLRFKRHRGLALSLVLCGTGLAAAALPPLLSAAVARWGWQAGYLSLGGLVLVFWLSTAWRNLPAQGVATNRTPTDGVDGIPWRQAVGSRSFWTCNIALALVVSALYGLTANTVPMLRGLGFSAATAAGIFSSFGVALIAGRIFVGALIDRYWAPGVAAIVLAMPAIGCALLLSADAHTPLALLVAATALCGVGAGAEFDIAAYLVSRYFGLRDYGRLFGMHLGLVTIGSAVSPFAFGALLKASGYHPLFMLCGGACVLGPALLLTLGRYPDLSKTETKP